MGHETRQCVVSAVAGVDHGPEHGPRLGIGPVARTEGRSSEGDGAQVTQVPARIRMWPIAHTRGAHR